MDVIKIRMRKGLDLPLSGVPEQRIDDAPTSKTVAVVGPDYLGLRPSMLVEEGQDVALGQPLFEDKRNPGVLFTAPAAGRVKGILRGAQRMLQAVVIEVQGDAEVRFDSYAAEQLPGLPRDSVRDQLVQSGLWTAIRRRPYSKIPHLDEVPDAIFVTAIDTNPLAADPVVALQGLESAFEAGVSVLTRLTEGPVYVCKAPGAAIPAPTLPQVQVAEFDGPHPAGLPGTHIHFLSPVSSTRRAWYLNYQDVAAVGKLFLDGRLWTQRIISVGGPMVTQPRLLRTVLGANVDDIMLDGIADSESRVLSGSVLNGRRALNWAAYLGRYHLQITVMHEGREREFMGWIAPGKNKFSVTRAFLSTLMRSRRLFSLSTSTQGSPRAMVPIGNYEKVMPLDILPTQLLRYLLVKDTENAQNLGALELDEEDLALCSFVCVGKYEYGPVLRANLDQIEEEG